MSILFTNTNELTDSLNTVYENCSGSVCTASGSAETASIAAAGLASADTAFGAAVDPASADTISGAKESSGMHRLVLKTSEICVNIYSNKKVGALSQSRTLCDIFLKFWEFLNMRSV